MIIFLKWIDIIIQSYVTMFFTTHTLPTLSVQQLVVVAEGQQELLWITLLRQTKIFTYYFCVLWELRSPFFDLSQMSLARLRLVNAGEGRRRWKTGSECWILTQFGIGLWRRGTKSPRSRPESNEPSCRVDFSLPFFVIARSVTTKQSCYVLHEIAMVLVSLAMTKTDYHGLRPRNDKISCYNKFI